MNEVGNVRLAEDAPGAPGISPTWTSSAKEMVGCGLGASRLWFTIGFGIVNEIYYPRVDLPQVRDMGFIVADDAGFWVEVKRLGNHELCRPAPGIPVAHIVHRHERFELTVRVTPDPERDVLLVETVLDGDETLRLFVLLAPHLGGTGYSNKAAIDMRPNRQVLSAEREAFALALVAADRQQQDAFRRTSAGYVGVSDGWQDFARHGAMTWSYERAGPGNVALMGELTRYAVLALGFSDNPESAATLAVSALLGPFKEAWSRQCHDWEAWHTRCQTSCMPMGELPERVEALAQTSAMVLRSHQDKTYPGTMVASLSIPWGNSRDDVSGYHLVWPRDLVECAGALLALGDHHEARNILRYLIATQLAEGHWYQNQWLSGAPYWHGIQLDEVGMPVLLAAALAERDALQGIEVRDMVRRALGYIVRNGPFSEQDRWEENAGVNTFTLAVCLAALVSGSVWLEPDAGDLALAIADFWNAHIEAWTAACDTDLARRLGVKSYYIRSAPRSAITQRKQGFNQRISIKNRAQQPGFSTDEQVGVDFLQLVRFGLRRADDRVVLDSIKVIDALLKVETPSGPSWLRYNGDGYGETPDGIPFAGVGQGRPWPLLTGERGHYEIVAGRDPLPFLQAMVAMSSDGGMLPEQVWDGNLMPDRGLSPGRPTGSAMPLAWTHAEFLKLVYSRALGRPFDRPQAVWSRYRGRRPKFTRVLWSESCPIGTVPAGCDLIVCLHQASVLHWGHDGWQDVCDYATRVSALGVHIVVIPAAALAAVATIEFTYRVVDNDEWCGRDYQIESMAKRGGRSGTFCTLQCCAQRPPTRQLGNRVPTSNGDDRDLE